MTGCGCPAVLEGAARRITWIPASYPAVHSILTNPAYAGTFAYGRGPRPGKSIGEGGQVITRQQKLPRTEWEVVIPGHHPGYLTWEAYEANIARLAANKTPPRGQGGGAPREGRALLQGLLRCGRCGRMMQTGYSGPAGNSPRYLCARIQMHYGRDGAHACQSTGGRRLEQTVLAELFAVLAPAALAATAQAMAEAETCYRQRLQVFELAAERARYEADRALRQFNAVEPENRLVARTLERALEDKLAAVRAAGNDLAAQQARRPVTLTGAEIAWISSAGADVRAVFDAPATTTRERKQLIRAVITEVVLTVNTQTRDRGPADHLAGRRQHRADHAHQQDRRALPRHARGHRGPGTPSRPALPRHHHRPYPGPAAPPHRHRPAVDQDPRQEPASLSRHSRLPAPAQRGKCR